MRPIRTRRWNDPALPDDGHRLLVTRYLPRGVAKAQQTTLHAAAYAKIGEGIPWPVYRSRYLLEMRSQREAIAELAARVTAGETITLLCSSACERESRCHRSLLRELIEAEAAKQLPNPDDEIQNPSETLNKSQGMKPE